MQELEEKFSLDYRIMRVALASDNPIETIHKINTNQYSIKSFLDTLELLDAKATFEEFEILKRREVAGNQNGGIRR